MNNKTIVLALACLVCSQAAFAQHDLEPLADDEGYLLVSIKMTMIAVRRISIDGGGSMFYAHNFRGRDLEPGVNYKIIKLKEGDYFWRQVQMENKSYFDFEDEEYPLTVKAGYINYGGFFEGAAAGMASARFNLTNRGTEAMRYLASCCAALANSYPIRYASTDDDPFLNYYFSLLEATGDSGANAAIAEEETDTSEDATVAELIALLDGGSEQDDRDPEDYPAEEQIRDFVRQNRYYGPKISPNGRLVAAFESVDGRGELVVIDPIRSSKLSIIEERPGRMGLRSDSLYWVDDTRIAFTITLPGLDRMGLVTLMADDTGKLADAQVEALGDDWLMIDPLPHVDEQAMIMRFYDGSRTLARVDVTDADGAFKGVSGGRLQSKIRDTQAWWLDYHGNTRIAIEIDDDNKRKIVWYRPEGRTSWREVWEGDPLVHFEPVLVEPDDETIVVVSNENTENRILTRYNRTTGTYGEPVLAVPNHEITGVVTDATRSRVVNVTYVDKGIVRHRYLDDRYQSLIGTLDSETYGSAPYIIGMSLDERFALIQTSTNDDPGAFFLFDSEENLSYRFGSVRPWISTYRLGTGQTIETPVDDDTVVESFLTLPDAEEYPRPPLIVMPHGGPINVRDTRHFSGQVQLLASLGYAVLQTNYRGSGGYGKSFQASGEGQWGRQIEDDIEAALQSVLDMQLVDSDRICIFGSSYGGYSALISAIRSPDVYKCAASFAGVTDMTLLFHTLRINRSNILRELIERIVGDPDDEIDALIEYSPVYNADKITIPVFLAHGAKDSVVGMEHFRRMRTVLDHHQVDAEYMVLSDEGHGLRRVGSNVEFFQRLDNFFREHLDLPAYDPARSRQQQD